MTHSGTQFNMNVNEVISNRCSQLARLGSRHHAGRLGARPRQPLQSCFLFRVQQNRRRRTHDFVLHGMDERHA